MLRYENNLDAPARTTADPLPHARSPRSCRIAAKRSFRKPGATIRNPQSAIRNRCAYTLLEMTIAVGILGVGLIMVAAIFPVALTQHRNSTEQARVIEMVSEAQAMLAAKVNSAELWVHPAFLPGPIPGDGPLAHQDSPWYLLPTVNLLAGNDCWDAMAQGPVGNENLYANWLNADGGIFLPAPPSPFGNVPMLFGLDILSDRLAPFSLLPEHGGSGCPDTIGVLHASASPFTSEEFMEAPNRLVWYGFYRRRASGSFEFAAAVCKQRRNQRFAEQDAVRANPTLDPAMANMARRLPVPWRLTVARRLDRNGNCASNLISNEPVAGSQFSGSIGVAHLAPVGSKVMISGGGDSFDTPMFPLPASRILTVSDIFDDYTVEVVGEMVGLPCYDFGSGAGVVFDIWVFPPAVEAGFLGRESPLLDWKVPL